jgi:hypothetical protein
MPYLNATHEPGKEEFKTILLQALWSLPGSRVIRKQMRRKRDDR